MDGFLCNLCTFRTKWKANLKTHMTKKHLKEQQEMFYCDECEYASNYTQNDEQQMRAQRQE